MKPCKNEKSSTGYLQYIMEDQVDNMIVLCYSILIVPNKMSLHQESGRGLEPGRPICIVSNRYAHRSTGLLEMIV